MIKDALRKSLVDVKDNVVLFLPELVYFVLIMLGVLAVIFATGITPVLESLVGQPQEKVQEALQQFLTENFAQVLATFLVFLASAFIVGSSLMAMKLGAAAAVVQKGSTDLRTLLAARRSTGWIILARFLQFLCYLPSLVIGIIVFVLLYNVYQQAAFWAAISLAIIGFFLTSMALLFVYPFMYLKQLRPLDALRASLSFFQKHKKFTMSVLLTMISVALVFNVAMAILDMVTAKKASLLFSLLSYFVLTVYLPLFTFHVFSAKIKRR